MNKSLPEYYKTVKFTTTEGVERVGYLEPPFTDEDCAFFIVPMIEEKKEGYDALFFHPDDVVSWKYV